MSVWLCVAAALVADESGFPNETTFLRNFKAQTGLTPSEWKASEELGL